MKLTRFTFDPCTLIAGILTLLLIFGVVPFTATWIGIILLVMQTELKMSWDL